MQINMPMRKEIHYFILPATALPDARVAEQITLKSIQENIADLKTPSLSQRISSEQLVFDHNGNKIIYNYKGENIGKFLLSIIH